MQLRIALTALAIVAALGSYADPSCGQPASPADATAQARALFAEQWQWTLREFPEFATFLGDHRYDDRLSDQSAAAVLRRRAARAGFLERADKIDIVDKDVRKGDLPALLFNYKPSPLRIVDDGHMIQVNYAHDSWVTVNGKRYELVSIEFHKPGEAKVNGKGHEMEADLVHKAQDGKLLIIAVPLDAGTENRVVKAVVSNLPATKGKEQEVAAASIYALELLPKDKGYYMYTGSLTAPPCTENVLWYVLKSPIQVSTDQIARFARVYPMNARPTQPRNDRDIIGTP